ncbi:MAG: choice-of-anchor I family protein [Verrucomicrobiota bacterium]
MLIRKRSFALATLTIFTFSVSLIAPTFAGGFFRLKEKGHITISPRTTIITGDPEEIFDEGAAEIVAYDSRKKRLYISNGNDSAIDIIDIRDVDNPQPILQLPTGEAPTSVAVNPRWWRNEIAVAVPADPEQNPGSVKFYDTSGNVISEVTVGALPDMLTYGPWGRYLFVANEGEPNDDYDNDPNGSISIIDVRRGAAKVNQDDVHTVEFTSLNGMEDELRDAGVRIFGPGASASQDLEPEYITVTPDGKTAFAICQENNAIVEIDVKTKSLATIFSLGTKDHSIEKNAIDASNRDDRINITTWPTHGFYMPDAIASYRTRGKTYIVSANEGDARDYDGFSEEARVGSLELDPTIFPNAAELQLDENLGRLNITTANGDNDNDDVFEKIFSYGARSFSIWNTAGDLVYDSGDDFEQIIAERFPADFNSTNDENDSFDNRSDDKGPEPEGVVVGWVGRDCYAFIGLERIGGIMIYNITNPRRPVFCDYVNNRDFSGDAEAGTAGDLGPEGLLFISAFKSPTRRPLLVVANEVSGTTTIYDIVKRKD